jgi:hypothetical protein
MMIYAVDIGSTLPRPKGSSFAWAMLRTREGIPEASTDPRALVDSLAADLRAGRSVALGLEAPLFIPVPEDVSRLSRARTGESNRSWSAPAGGYVATLAAHQAAWLLRELWTACGSICELTVDPYRWTHPPNEVPLLFVWEAFVSGPAHMDHSRDAVTAVMYFLKQKEKLHTAVTAENPLSLFGTAVLWSGWSNDLTWLHQPLLVLRPPAPWNGEFHRLTSG